MATAVVLNLPEHGHMNATFPVIAELVQRGERVVYFATEPFRARIEAAGAEYVSYGDPAAFRPPAHRGGVYSVMDWSMSLAENVLPGLIDRLRELRPDYLLIDSMCVWGALARQILQLPAATLASVFVPNDRYVTVEEMVARAYGQADQDTLLFAIEAFDRYIQTAQRIDRRWGTRSPNLVEFFAGRQALNVVFTSREFHLAGESYDSSYCFTGPSIPEPNGIAPEPPGGDPLVYISLGTIFNQRPEFFRACFEALGDEQCHVIAVVGEHADREAIGPAPSNFTLCAHTDQLSVLRRASVFLTHGGMNSVNEALWHGVPVLAYPQHGDQFLVAQRAMELGAGVILRPGDAEAAGIREGVRQLLTETRYREAARAIAGTFRSAGGYRRAAEEILAWRPR